MRSATPTFSSSALCRRARRRSGTRSSKPSIVTGAGPVLPTGSIISSARRTASRVRASPPVRAPCSAARPGADLSLPSMPSASAALTCTLTAGLLNASVSTSAAFGSLRSARRRGGRRSSLPVSRPLISASSALRPERLERLRRGLGDLGLGVAERTDEIGRRGQRLDAELAERLRGLAADLRGAVAHDRPIAPPPRPAFSPLTASARAALILTCARPSLQREHHLVDVDRVGVLGELRRAELALLEVGDVLRQPIDRHDLLARDHREARPASPRCARRAPDRWPRAWSRHAMLASISALPNRPRPPTALIRIRLRSWRVALIKNATPGLPSRPAASTTVFIARSNGTSSAAISSSSALPTRSASAPTIASSDLGLRAVERLRRSAGSAAGSRRRAGRSPRRRPPRPALAVAEQQHHVERRLVDRGEPERGVRAHDRRGRRAASRSARRRRAAPRTAPARRTAAAAPRATAAWPAGLARCGAAWPRSPRAWSPGPSRAACRWLGVVAHPSLS